MISISGAVWLLPRLSLVAMFPFSAIDKIWHWRACLAQTRSSGLPGAKVMLIAAILVEAVTPLCIVSGVWDRAAAVILAGFCVVTAILYHPFWSYPDFWSDDPASVAREHFWQFVKNFGLVGGLLLVVFAGTLADPRTVMANPFSSTRQTQMR
ncbi:DoxX family protein [Glacieibacterium sp.]|uniref:DoxX family protein n=1 Tax=Glacieibacterium sp. TaxID=2860237 RepID=UPI003B00E7E7